MKNNFRFQKLIYLAAAAGCCLLGATPANSASGDSKQPATWIRVTSGRGNFLVFTGPAQSYAGSLSSAVVATIDGAPGAVLSIDRKQAVLHTGSLRVDARKGNAKIGNRYAATTIDEGARAFLSAMPSSKTLKIMCLSGKSAGAVSVRGAKKLGAAVLAAGDEAYCGPEGLSKRKSDAADEVEKKLISSGENGPAHLVAADGTEFRFDRDKVMVMRTGESFIVAPDDLLIAAGGTEIEMKKGSIADVEVLDGDVRVKALSGPGHINVHCGTVLPVHPGQELLISSHSIEEQDQFPPDGVGRRRAERLPPASEKKLLLSDFSIISFLNSAEHMHNIKAGETADDKQFLTRILKTAAAVQHTSGQQGAYKAVTRSRKRTPGRDVRGGSA